MGPVSTVIVTFDTNCTVLRDRNGNNLRILKIPNPEIDPRRLELCTAIGIERIEIMNDMSITSLNFMRNIRVRPLTEGRFISLLITFFCFSSIS